MAPTSTPESPPCTTIWVSTSLPETWSGSKDPTLPVCGRTSRSLITSCCTASSQAKAWKPTTATWGRPDKVKCPHNNCNPADKVLPQNLQWAPLELGHPGEDIPPRHHCAWNCFLRVRCDHAALRCEQNAPFQSQIWQ